MGATTAPYTESDVVAYEVAIGVRLPESLRLYLLNVSRKTGEHVVFNLKATNIGVCIIPQDVTTITYRELSELTNKKYGNTYDDRVLIRNDEYCDDEAGMVQIGKPDDDTNIYIVVQGNHAGSIWENCHVIEHIELKSKTFSGFIKGDN